MADHRDAAEIGLGFAIRGEIRQGGLDERFSVGRRIGGTRPVHLLKARQDDEPALASQVIDPGPVALGIHDAPAMQEHGDRPTGLGSGSCRVEGVGARGAASEEAFDHGSLAISDAPRAVGRLRWRRRRLGRQRSGQDHDRGRGERRTNSGKTHEGLD
jgi:hypothetical protein